MESLYEVLGVRPEADTAQLRSAYRTAVRRAHPDLNQETGANRRFLEIQYAWEVLRDPRRRAAYDADRRADRRVGCGAETVLRRYTDEQLARVVFVRRSAPWLRLVTRLFRRRPRRNLR